MNTTGRLFLRLIFLSIISGLPAVPSDAATAEAKRAGTKAATEWSAKRRSEHQTEWSIVRYSTNAGTGRVRSTTHSYVELATCLNRLDPATGQWVESKEEIELVQDGAIARQGGHKAAFSANLNTPGAIQLATTDGKLLRSHVLGLAYTDATSGKSVLIAGIKDSIGEIVGNQVIYRDAFDGEFKADVRYTYTRAGFEQDVILREVPPSPADYGIDPATARLEVWTEFLQPPQPVKTASTLKVKPDPRARQAMVDPDLTDEALNFGVMRIGSGNAFPIEGNASTLNRNDVPVGKNWLRLDGRDFLIEKVDYGDVLPSLEKLPARAAAVLQPAPGKQQAALRIQPRQQLLAALKPPARREARNRAASEPMRMAALMPAEKGFVLDYSAVGSQANMVFKANETYHVIAAANLTGTTVIEGGTVVKFNNSGAYLTISGGIDCRTESYRPAYFTARDDNSVGEIVPGSTGVPSGYYAAYIFYLSDATTSYDLHDLRLRYGNQAIFRGGGSGATPIVLRHSQIQNCNRAFGNYTSPVTLRNVLVYRTVFAFFSNAGVVDLGENVTFHCIGNLISAAGQSPLQLKNTLLISCTNNVSYVADPTVINQFNEAGVFQTSGLGYHYLAPASPYRGVGTPNINATLLSELKQTTTWPPLILSGTIAQNTILSSVATRNSTTAPDLGYAYSAMDYLAQNLLVQGSTAPPVTLLVTNGAVVGLDPTIGPAGGVRYGISFGNYSELVSVGTPDKLNRFIPIQTLQENGPVSANWPVAFDTFHAYGLGLYPNAFLRFTDLTLFAGTTHRHLTYWSGGFLKLAIQDSQIRGGTLNGLYLASDIPNHVVALTNILLEQVQFTYHPYAFGLFHAYNNFFKGGSLIFDNWPAGNPVWTFRDNLFDGTTITQSGGTTTANDYNAYVTAQTTTRLTPAPSPPHDQILTSSPAYEVGAFGSNYLPSSATSLINQGSRTAANAGLYHYTTSKTAVSKEGSTQVDIGLHYASANAQNQPLDSDGDTLPDYFEDRNGNGIVNSDETNYNNADTDGDGISDSVEPTLWRSPLQAEANVIWLTPKKN